MTDPLDLRLPLLYSGTSIKLRDTYDAPDRFKVPLTYGGISCRANQLVNLPAHARVAALHGASVLSPETIADVQPEPPSTYRASAVRFADAVSLYSVSVAAIDNAFFSFSFWQRADPLDLDRSIFHWFNSAGAPSCDIKASDDSSGQTDVYLSDPSGDSWLDALSAIYDKTVWHHFLGSFDAGALKRVAFYVDDVDAGATVESDGVAFIHAVNAAAVQIRGEGGGVDLADLRIMPGVDLLDGTGHIPEATRRLFIDANGKPVDPAIATAALSAPCILFSGDASTFVANQGTGGSFTLTGTLTDAPISPSD